MKRMEPYDENQSEEHEASMEKEGATITSREKQDRFLPISILVAAVVIGGAVLFASLYKGSQPTVVAAQNNGNNGTAGQAAVSPASIMTLGARDAILGDSNAPVTIIEYGDYQCPYCVQFFTQTEPLIVQNYVKTGKVKMVFRNFAFLDRMQGVPAGANESHDAAAAMECAEDQNLSWAYHDALYAAKAQDEKNGGSEDDGFLNRTLFLKLAGQVNLNVPTFTTCIDTKKYQAQIDAEQAAASAVGVQSTPTFFINGQQITGAQPYASFKAVIDALIK